MMLGNVIETSVLLTKVEELFEDHVQPLIGKFRKWGCDASKISRRPPSAQSFPIEDKKQDKL
jgi:hypothetical protein